jgi:outer membrane murein-binding lipoprotein Lpp
MSLSEAGSLLGIAPNSVRSRYKSGKIRGERDNEGRIWVWLDPASLPSKVGSKTKPSNSSIEGSKRSEFEALQDHIATLKRQLDAVTAEAVELRPRAAERDRLEAEVAGLQAQIELLKTDRDEWRRTAQAQLQSGSRGGFFGLFRRRA